MIRHFGDADRRKCVDWHLSCWPGPEAHEGFIELHRAKGEADPTALQHHLDRGIVEIIPEVSIAWDLDRSAIICLDLDPKFDMPFDDLKVQIDWMAKALPVGVDLLDGITVVAHKIRYSGNRSLHLWLALSKPTDLAACREAVKRRLGPVVRSRPILTLDPKQDGRVVYLDVNTMARHRCVRCCYSLHMKTGLVCVPVVNLDRFEKEQAAPEEVLKRGHVAEPF